MNREIKFRGKSLRCDTWVCGHYCRLNNTDYIILQPKSTAKDNEDESIITMAEEIDIKTLGEYIGLKDYKGQEVYEGDIILSPWWDDEPQEVKFHKYGFKGLDIRQKIVHGRELYEGIDDLLEGCFGEVFEVIGNIHDNPELLEGEW